MTTNPKLGLSSIEIRCMDTEQSCIVSTTRNSSSHPRKPFWLTTFPPFLLKKTVSELFSTFLLVFVTCGAAALHRSSQDMRVSQLGSSAAGGLIVTVMIYSVGHISGAHMNPAVTLAFAASKHVHFPWIQVPFYWSAQLSGAILASFVLKALLYPITDMGTTTPSGTPLQALIMETVVTFCMMFVASAVGTDTKAVRELAGLAVGSSVCITSILAGPVSGGSMNPARTLGPAIASDRYEALWVYFVGPVMGTLLAAWAYNFVRLDGSENELPERPTSFKLSRLRSGELANVDV
ncbi:hypothetical protein HPP92_016795 [Vanilla planifolia]|uniref:Uncharacterized protein n=1 Tax=Vanilla planifolia TaxID=51239 RepID=A0A835URL6_VANPL|nr:hypothetical protein HPP92_016795 [Vanilla planifolia]